MATNPCILCGGSGTLYHEREGLPPSASECICRRQERAMRRARLLREASGVSERVFERLTFETFRPGNAVKARCDMAAIKRACEAFVEDPRGWLVLTGSYGVGKTHLAYAIVGGLLRRLVPVYVASVPEMLTMIRNGYEDRQGMSVQERLEALRTVEVLVLDDWGAEKSSDWVSETLFSVLNHRYNERLPMVVTTNMSPAELAQREPRLASRLLDRDLSQVLVLNAGDYRQRGQG